MGNEWDIYGFSDWPGVLKYNGYGINQLREEDRTQELCMIAFQNYPGALKYIENQTEEMCLDAVRRDGLALRFVKEQTEGICLAAVKQFGWALRFVKSQYRTPEVCMEAVKQNPAALEFVKDQTPQLCAEALKQNWRAIYAINRPTSQHWYEAYQKFLQDITVVSPDKNPDTFIKYIKSEALLWSRAHRKQFPKILSKIKRQEQKELGLSKSPSLTDLVFVDRTGHASNQRQALSSDPSETRSYSANELLDLLSLNHRDEPLEVKSWRDVRDVLYNAGQSFRDLLEVTRMEMTGKMSSVLKERIEQAVERERGLEMAVRSEPRTRQEVVIPAKPVQRPVMTEKERLTVLTQNGIAGMHQALSGMSQVQRNDFLSKYGMLEDTNRYDKLNEEYVLAMQGDDYVSMRNVKNIQGQLNGKILRLAEQHIMTKYGMSAQMEDRLFIEAAILRSIAQDGTNSPLWPMKWGEVKTVNTDTFFDKYNFSSILSQRSELLIRKEDYEDLRAGDFSSDLAALLEKTEVDIKDIADGEFNVVQGDLYHYGTAKENYQEYYKAAVERNPVALIWVKQTPDLCMDAVCQNGMLLKFVREQTPEICKKAVQQNWRALQYSKYQTPDVCKSALQQDAFALCFIPEPTSSQWQDAFKNYLSGKEPNERTVQEFLHIIMTCDLPPKGWEDKNLGIHYKEISDLLTKSTQSVKPQKSDALCQIEAQLRATEQPTIHKSTNRLKL